MWFSVANNLMSFDEMVQTVEEVIQRTDSPELFRDILGLDNPDATEYRSSGRAAYPHNDMSRPHQYGSLEDF